MDTNILYAGLYSARGASHQVLQNIYRGRITPIISTTLLFEYEDVLKRKQTELNLSYKEIDLLLDNICAYANYQEIYFLWRPYLKDPKDDHVLEVGVASETGLIVTHNIKDFKKIDKFGIRAIPPRELLEIL